MLGASDISRNAVTHHPQHRRIPDSPTRNGKCCGMGLFVADAGRGDDVFHKPTQTEQANQLIKLRNMVRQNGVVPAVLPQAAKDWDGIVVQVPPAGLKVIAANKPTERAGLLGVNADLFIAIDKDRLNLRPPRISVNELGVSNLWRVPRETTAQVRRKHVAADAMVGLLGIEHFNHAPAPPARSFGERTVKVPEDVALGISHIPITVRPWTAGGQGSAKSRWRRQRAATYSWYPFTFHARIHASVSIRP